MSLCRNYVHKYKLYFDILSSCIKKTSEIFHSIKTSLIKIGHNC